MGVIFVIDCFPILATSTVKIVSDSDISTDRLPKNPLPLSLLGLSYFFLWRSCPSWGCVSLLRLLWLSSYSLVLAPFGILGAQSLVLCPILRQLKHWHSFMHNSLSSVVRQLMYMAFGSHGEWMYQGALVFLVCSVNLLFWLEISWNLRYCVSNLEVLSYHSWMEVGILSRANILERIKVWIPSIKYSIKALSLLILDRPARIRNWEIYSSAVPFPCLSCHSWARASPSESVVENAPLIFRRKSVNFPVLIFAAEDAVKESFLPSLGHSFIHVGENINDLLLVSIIGLVVKRGVYLCILYKGMRLSQFPSKTLGGLIRSSLSDIVSSLVGGLTGGLTGGLAGG